MSQLIPYIDEIARQKNRSVLFLSFPGNVIWDEQTNRKTIISWLDKNGIAWEKCGSLSTSWKRGSYNGDIYLDIEYNNTDERYKKLEAFLERPDGTIAFEGVDFYLLTLEQAVELGNVKKEDDDYDVGTT